MKFLVNVGGDLYIPCYECSAGNKHYSSIDIDPVRVDVNPEKQALYYLRQLVSKLQDSGGYGDPTERINLLYPEGEELELDISDLTKSDRFDLFVKEEYRPLLPTRFQYIDRRICFDNRPVDRKQKVRNFFGNAHSLELSHIGSPGVECIPRDDFSVYCMWSSKEDEKKSKDLIRKLEMYRKKRIRDLDILELSILFSVASSEYPLSECEITDSIKEPDYFCTCYFDQTSIEERLYSLVERGLLKEVDGQFITPPEFRRRQFYEELNRNFAGVMNIGKKDLVSAAALLTLAEESAKIPDILAGVKNYGLEIDEEGLSCRLENLAKEGIINKDLGGWFDMNPAYRRIDKINQLSFNF